MNWTSRTPIENVKCIVETNTGSIFPARYINGTWWNATRAFVIDGVTRWIVYPEGEDPNDYIAPEALLKYLVWSIDEICIGQGRTEWGAPENKETFIIKLEERLL